LHFTKTPNRGLTIADTHPLMLDRTENHRVLHTAGTAVLAASYADLSVAGRLMRGMHT
jgi:hypothetical protein